jgi:hypothetical protein
MLEIDIKNEKNYITLLVSLGHIAFHIPNSVGNQLKTFITRTVFKELLFTGPASVDTDDSSSNSQKLAGKWCENEDELPFETRAQVCIY